MEYRKVIKLKDGRECCLRNAMEDDGESAWLNFKLTHEQTDFLLSYSDEDNFTPSQEGQFLREKTESDNEIEMLAEVDGKVVGLAGIEAVGNKYKIRHRCDFGISIEKDFWNLGIGNALTNACIECAKKAGYEQIELNVVTENTNAISMYKKCGFEEYGRNPRGFKSKLSGYQEVIYMRKELV